MHLFSRSSSRTVDESNLEEEMLLDKEKCTSLTVWRKSLVFSCKGFTVIGPDGNLIYRVDSYTGRPSRLVLMDGSGNTLLTILRRKNLGLVDKWLIYEGEEFEDLNNNKRKAKDPIFVLKKNISLLAANMNVVAYVYKGMNEKRCSYLIEGSYANRSCRVFNKESRRVVAEIKKKEAMKGSVGVSFGLEVFLLIVKPGFDSKFAMAFTLLLDQMFS